MIWFLASCTHLGPLRNPQHCFSRVCHFGFRNISNKTEESFLNFPASSLPPHPFEFTPCLTSNVFLLINCTIRSLQIRRRKEEREATSFPENNTIISAPLDRNVRFHSPLLLSPISKNQPEIYCLNIPIQFQTALNSFKVWEEYKIINNHQPPEMYIYCFIFLSKFFIIFFFFAKSFFLNCTEKKVLFFQHIKRAGKQNSNGNRDMGFN